MFAFRIIFLIGLPTGKRYNQAGADMLYRSLFDCETAFLSFVLHGRKEPAKIKGLFNSCNLLNSPIFLLGY